MRGLGLEHFNHEVLKLLRSFALQGENHSLVMRGLGFEPRKALSYDGLNVAHLAALASPRVYEWGY